MPIYEYECSECGERIEHIQSMSDPPLELCPSCSKRALRRLISAPAFQFKGSGWYVTDYARKGQAEGDGQSSGAQPSGDQSSSDQSSSDRSSGAESSSDRSSSDQTPRDPSSTSRTGSESSKSEPSASKAEKSTSSSKPNGD